MYSTTLTLKFNDTLQRDPDGRFSVYYGEHFNTPRAELVTEGATYQTHSVSFNVPNFPGGRELAFIGLGMDIACYTQYSATIKPGPAVVWLSAKEEWFQDVQD